MVGYTQNPIKSFCMSLYTNKYYLTYLFGSREKKSSKMYERGGQAHPSLEYISKKVWSWLDLVGYAKFRSIALVVWHRFQQRKLIPAKIEKHKKQTHNQNTESPKTTRQDSPEKNNKSKKQKPQKKQSKPGVWQVLIILCFASLFSFCVLWYCIFLTAIFFMLFGSKAWYTKRFKTNSLQSFLARKKKKSQKCMKGRGDRPTPP